MYYYVMVAGIPSIDETQHAPCLVVAMDAQEYLTMHPNERRPWFYEKLISSLPDGEIKQSIYLAREEELARRQVSVADRWGNPEIEESNRYAFRGFKRRSDEQPVLDHPDATYANAMNLIGSVGIDSAMDRSLVMISPNVIWDTFLLPDPQELGEGVDRSMLLVYRNRPFFARSFSYPTKYLYVDINSPDIIKRAHQITEEDAIKSGLPTLLDNLIGLVEVHWIIRKTDATKSGRFCRSIKSIFQR